MQGTSEGPCRGTVAMRWICFVQAPGLIPGGETHPIFCFVRLLSIERSRWEPHGSLIYLFAAGGVRKVNL